MKKQFSKSWNSSKQPRKQRKFRANAPLHIKRKFLTANLSKELRKKHNKRNIGLRKGDKIRIMRGEFKNKEGKITEIKTKKQRIFVEGIQKKKKDGSKINIPLSPSNLQIIELNLEDKKRIQSISKETKIIKEKKKVEQNIKSKKDKEILKKSKEENAPKKK